MSAGDMVRSAQATYRDEREAERLQAELDVLIELHQYASQPYHDINDVKGYLTARKRTLRNKIKKLTR